MDSTPSPTLPQPLSIKTSASKLPIKRKTPDSDPHPTHIPKPESTSPPFKFHRIWTEPDEIRFLQGLLDCSSLNLTFPRDLHVFFSRFSGTMSQPYTKSQLSEKLRRLRKKFRVISSRLSRGLDKTLLSPHDRALHELSMKLWHPDFSSSSPFRGTHNNSNDNGNSSKAKESKLVGVKVSFSPVLPVELNQNRVLHGIDDGGGGNDDGFIGDGGFESGGLKLSEVNVEFEEEAGGGMEEQAGVSCTGKEEEVLEVSSGSGFEIGEIVGKVLIDVFDECLEEVRMGVVQQGVDCCGDDDGGGSSLVGLANEDEGERFEKRWREQRVAELDVLAHRLRLVLEHSLRKQ